MCTKTLYILDTYKLMVKFTILAKYTVVIRMGREEWEYIPVRKNTRKIVERIRALLILQYGEKKTYDDTIQYMLQFLPEEVIAKIESR